MRIFFWDVIFDEFGIFKEPLKYFDMLIIKRRKKITIDAHN